MAELEPLLFLCHRLPFPPNKGDKIRSFQILRFLSKRYRVYLGTFIDDSNDEQYVESVRQYCADLKTIRIAPWRGKLRSTLGFIDGTPLSVAFYRNRILSDWIDAVTRRERIARALVFSSSMGQFLIGNSDIAVVADFVDLDSAKWQAYAERYAWPLSMIYRREARQLLAFEQRVAETAQATTFVTPEETELFNRAAPALSSRAFAVGNGVDSVYFDPARPTTSPYPSDVKSVVFTGAMDYWPNIDAVEWFASDVLPTIRAHRPDVRFFIVGMNPSPRVQRLAGDGVVVTGRVPDVRPYLQHAAVVVAPLRVARGVQNKVLEAMAMARTVITTTACAAGIQATPDSEIVLADDASAFADAVIAHLASPAAIGKAARERVLAEYDWDAKLNRLGQLIEGRRTSRVETAARIPLAGSA